MIIRHVIEILQTEENLFINDLGLFEKKLIPARIEEGILYPPQYKIFFNAHAEGNGFSFTLKYSEKEQKRLTDADQEINEWVKELKNGLEHNKNIHFEGFGTFLLDKKNHILFESDHIKSLNIEYEGMEPIPAVPLKELTRKAKEEKMPTAPEEMSAHPSMPVVDEEHWSTKPASGTCETDEKEPEGAGTDGDDNSPEIAPIKAKKRDKPILVIILCSLLIIGLGVFAYLERVPIELTIRHYLHEWRVRKASYDSKSQKTLPLAKEAEEVIPTIEHEITDTLPDIPEDLTIEEPLETVPVVSGMKSSTERQYAYMDFQEGKYYVIAGSFTKENDALKHIKDKHLDQYTPVLLTQKGSTRIRVCIAIFDQENEAFRFVKQTNQSYWVLQ